MANTKKKSGLGAESYFQNIPSLEPAEEEDAPSEAAQTAVGVESAQSEDDAATEAEIVTEELEASQAVGESGDSGETSGSQAPETTSADAQAEPSTDELPADGQEIIEATIVETMREEVASSDGSSSELTKAEQPVEGSITEFEARISPVDEDDLAQAPDAEEVDEEPEQEDEEEPERMKIRRTYALYEETQIALEEMKLAARKQGIKTTLGDILEEAVLLLMEKKGMTPDM